MNEKQAKPYTSIKDYLDMSPQELSSPGGKMEYYPRITNLARFVTSKTMREIIIEDEEIKRYQEAGTVLVAPTHRSYLDIVATSVLSDRSGEGQPFFMSKRENMDNKFTAWLLGHMRTFPIDRDMTDERWGYAFLKWGRYAMGNDSEKGEQNKKLVMFPEGTRKTGDKIEDLEKGTLLLANRMRVPILPVGVATSHMGALKGRPTTLVAVGEPYNPRKTDIDYLASKMQEQFDRANANLAEYLAR